MTRGRTLAWLLAAASAAIMGVSVWRMAARASGYYRDTDHESFVFRDVQDREFRFAGLPVSITDTTDAPPGVVVRYGEREFRIDATRRIEQGSFPGLSRHEQWLRVLRFAPRGRMTSDELEAAIDAGTVADRLVIAVYDPRIWADGRPMGEGQSGDALFTLHELLPGGEIRTETYSYPLSRRAAAAPPRTGAPPLPEDSWQYYASLMLMPRGSKPTPRFTSDAVRSLGWTLPAAAFSGLTLTLSLPFALAPRRKKPATGDATSAPE
jgi:hypothetical protein